MKRFVLLAALIVRANATTTYVDYNGSKQVNTGDANIKKVEVFFGGSCSTAADLCASSAFSAGTCTATAQDISNSYDLSATLLAAYDLANPVDGSSAGVCGVKLIEQGSCNDVKGFDGVGAYTGPSTGPMGRNLFSAPDVYPRGCHSNGYTCDQLKVFDGSLVDWVSYLPCGPAGTAAKCKRADQTSTGSFDVDGGGNCIEGTARPSASPSASPTIPAGDAYLKAAAVSGSMGPVTNGGDPNWGNTVGVAPNEYTYGVGTETCSVKCGTGKTVVFCFDGFGPGAKPCGALLTGTNSAEGIGVDFTGTPNVDEESSHDCNTHLCEQPWADINVDDPSKCQKVRGGIDQNCKGDDDLYQYKTCDVHGGGTDANGDYRTGCAVGATSTSNEWEQINCPSGTASVSSACSVCNYALNCKRQLDGTLVAKADADLANSVGTPLSGGDLSAWKSACRCDSTPLDPDAANENAQEDFVEGSEAAFCDV